MKKKMLKKVLCGFMLLAFLLAAIPAGFPIYSQAEGESTDSPEFVVSVLGSNVVSAGTTANLSIELKNTSTATYARNIFFKPIHNDSTKTSDYFLKSNVVTFMPVNLINVAAASTVEVAVDVDKYAAGGIYPYSFELTYKNGANVEETKVFTVRLKIEGTYAGSKLQISQDGNQAVSVAAGSSFTLPVLLSNLGDLYARDVKVTLTGLSQETFMMESGVGLYDIVKLEPLSNQKLSFNLKSSAALKTASYPVTFKIEYYDERGGDKRSEEQQYWVSVVGEASSTSLIEIVSLSASKTTVVPGDSFEVTLKIKNGGTIDTKDLKASAEAGTGLLTVSQNLFIIPAMKAGQEKTVTYRFQANPDAVRGSVPVTVKIESVDGTTTTPLSQALSVFIDAEVKSDDPNGSKNVPKIIVKSYAANPTLVKAAENFDLHLEFLNTHATKSIKNIKGSFTVVASADESGNVFSPVDGSNTVYIDEIKPKGTADWDLTLYTIPDAKNKTYTVTISFEYEDEAGNVYKADELIGIPVYQPSRFETSEISIPTDGVFVGQPIYVYFEMYNLGKTDLYNVKVAVEGENFDAQPKSTYLGNFESGRNEYYELNITPLMAGETTGRIKIQYENSSGEAQELVEEFSFNAMEMTYPEEPGFPVDGGPMPGEETKTGGFFTSIWFYIILGVVVAGAAVTVVLVVKKRKKSKEFEF